MMVRAAVIARERAAMLPITMSGPISSSDTRAVKMGTDRVSYDRVVRFRRYRIVASMKCKLGCARPRLKDGLSQIE